MARRVTKDEAQALAGGRESAVRKYPWEEWLDGEFWVLEKDDDFPGASLESFRKAALDTGQSRGLRVTTTKIGSTTLIIKATKVS